MIGRKRRFSSNIMKPRSRLVTPWRRRNDQPGTLSQDEKRESSPASENEAHEEESCSPAVAEGDSLDPNLETDDVVVEGSGENEINSRDVADSSLQKWKKRRAVAIYLVTLALLYADQNLLAPNLTEIGNEFGFDPDERDRRIGGHIAVAFFLVGAPVSFLVGWLADSHKRAPLFAVTVFVGELACFMTYFTTTFNGLFVCRVLTGVAVGGSLPIVYSVIGDLYKAGSRAAISAVISTGTGIGIAIGHSLAGFLGEKHGWRLPFLVVSIPSFFCALLVLTVPEPERGGKEAARLEIEAERRRIAGLDAEETVEVSNPVATLDEEQPEVNENDVVVEEEACREDLPQKFSAEKEHSDQRQSPERIDIEEKHPGADTIVNHGSATEEHVTNVTWRSTLEMLKTRSVILVLLQAAPGALPFGMTSVYLNDYLDEDRGMSQDEATSVLISFGAGNAIGVILGGFLGHFSYRRDVRYPPVIMGVTVMLSALPMGFLINSVDDSTNVGTTGIIAILAGILTIIPIPIERAILTNVCIPESRGRANAFLGIVDNLGKGLGPVFVSLLIDASSRQTAFNISLLGWIIGGMISLLLYKTVKADEARVQELVRQSLAEEEEEERGGQGEDPRLVSQSQLAAETSLGFDSDSKVDY